MRSHVFELRLDERASGEAADHRHEDVDVLPRAATTLSAKAVMALTSITSKDCTIRRRSAAATRWVSRSRSASTAYGTATIAPSARSRKVTACPSAPVPPVTTATRGIAVLHRGRRHMIAERWISS